MRNCHYFLNQFELALLDYNQAITLDEDNFLSFFNKGKSQLLLKNYEGASHSLLQSVVLNNKYAPSHYWLGVCEMEMGNSEKGCLHFKQAALLKDENAAKAVADLCGA